jgi:hypothetical protein
MVCRATAIQFWSPTPDNEQDKRYLARVLVLFRFTNYHWQKYEQESHVKTEFAYYLLNSFADHKKFQGQVIGTGVIKIFWNPLYGRPWTIPNTISEITTSFSS